MKFDLLGKAVRRFRLPVVDYTNAPIIIVPMQQGDVNSRFFEIALYDDRGDIDLSAYTRAIISGLTPSGITLTSEKCEISDDGSAVVINFGGGFASEPGRISCQVLFTNAEDNVALTTQTFYVVVTQTQFDKVIIDNDDDCNLLLSLLKEVEGVEKAIETAEEERVIAENERKSAENSRVQSEKERAKNEIDRNIAENLRVFNEDIREENETNRINAENAREEAEANRQAIVTELTQKVENGELNGKDGVGISNIASGAYETVGKNTITPITITKTDGTTDTFRVAARNGDGGNIANPNEEILWEGEKGEEELYRFIKEGEFSEDGIALGTENYLRHTWKILDGVDFNVGDVLKIEGHCTVKENYCEPHKQKVLMSFRCVGNQSFKLSDVLGGVENFDGLITEEELNKTISIYQFGVCDIQEMIFMPDNLGAEDYLGTDNSTTVSFSNPYIGSSYVLGGEVTSGNFKNLVDLLNKLKELNFDIDDELLKEYERFDGFNFAFNRRIKKDQNINNLPNKTNVWWKYDEEDKNDNRSALVTAILGQDGSSYSSQLYLQYVFPAISTNANLPLIITKVSVIR